MVVIRGIDPLWQAYETRAYPSMLYHHNLDAGPGIEPGSGAYETPEVPLLYPATNGLRCKNRTCAPWSQTKSDTISPIGVNLVPHDRIELPSPDYKTGVLPFN